MKQSKPLIAVSVYVRGTDLDPEYVSKVLGIKPSRSQRKGGLKARSTKVIAKIGVWVLSTASDSRPAPEMIDELLQKFGVSAPRLDQIEGVEDAFLDIFIGWKDSLNEDVEFRFTRSQIQKLFELGLSVAFYVDSPDGVLLKDSTSGQNRGQP